MNDDLGPGTLFVCGTPIGNLGDASGRLIETLKNVDLVACEDTRRTGRLLAHFGFKKPIISIYKHVERERSERVRDALRQGLSVAYVSDAGMPGISDPGARLVESVREAGYDVRVVPGPSAVSSALSLSGFPADRFVFGGFLPRKAAARRATYAEWVRPEVAAVFFESPHRLAKSVADLADVAPGAQVCLCHEMTKLHESVLRGPIAKVSSSLGEQDVLGEWVIVVWLPKAAT